MDGNTNTEKNAFAGDVAKRTKLLTIGCFASKLLVFLMVRLYTACLSPEEYSTADLIVDMANLLIPLASLGISEAIFRNVAGKDSDRKTYLTAGLVILGVRSLLFLCLSPLLTCIPLFEDTAWLIVLYVMFSNLHTVVSQYLYAVGRVKLFAVQGILNTALIIALNILFLPVLKLGVTGYVMSTFLADGLTTLFLVLYTRLWRSVRRIPLRELRTITGQMLRFCIPLVPATVCAWVISLSDRYMVYYMRSAAENGLYAAAYKIPTIMTYAVSIFSAAWKGSISAEEDNPTAWERHYTRSWSVYVPVAFAVGGCLILLSRPLSGILYSRDYSTAWTYIPILTVATVLSGLDTFLNSVYFTVRRTVWSMISAGCGAAMNILLNALLIPEYGAIGAAAATMISYLCILVLRVITTRRLIPFRQGRVRLTLNGLLLTAQACFATAAGTGFMKTVPGWALAAAAFAALCALNMRELAAIGISVLRRLRNVLFRKGSGTS